jgi:hypothetical protein
MPFQNTLFYLHRWVGVCILLGDSPVSEDYMPTFWNTLSVSSSWAGRDIHLSMKMEQTERPETLAYKLQMTESHPEESIQPLH